MYRGQGKTEDSVAYGNAEMVRAKMRFPSIGPSNEKHIGHRQEPESGHASPERHRETGLPIYA